MFVNVFSANAVSNFSTSLYVQLFNTIALHSLAAESRPRLSETEPTCFCSKTHLRSVGDFALNPSLNKNNVNKVSIFLLYRINPTCKLFLSMYTFIILTMRLYV